MALKKSPTFPKYQVSLHSGGGPRSKKRSSEQQGNTKVNKSLIRDHRLICSAALLALLGGCGGGGDEPTAPGVPTANLQQIAQVSSACGVQAPASRDSRAAATVSTDLVTVDQGEYKETISVLTSPTYIESQLPSDLVVPLFGQQELALADETGNSTMGLAMTGAYLMGSVGCVKSVVRAAPPTGTDQPLVNEEVIWTSKNHPVLPIDALSDRPISGFEYISNFDAVNATVLFTVSKFLLPSADGAMVCYLGDVGGWSCVVPSKTWNGSHHSFNSALKGAGVYVLIAPKLIET